MPRLVLRQGVDVFAQKMERKLRTKDVTKGSHGWEKLTSPADCSYLLNRIIRDVTMLQVVAWPDGGYVDKDKVLDNAVNAANHAMMIADNFGGLIGR